MRRDLPVELVAEDDHIFKLIGNGVLLRIPAVPDLSFLEKAEARSLHHLSCSAEAVGSEEDSRSKDALKKSGYQAAIFLAPFVYAEGLQHFSRSSEANRLALLPDGKLKSRPARLPRILS